MQEHQGLWKVKTANGIVGYFIVYVDDALAMGSTKWVEATMKAFSTEWECKFGGIIVRDETETELAVKSLTFLSITIELTTEMGLRLHQIEYLKTKLSQRNITKGRPNLPEVQEGTVCPVSPEYKKTTEYKHLLKQTQQEVGSLQWLALKTRPDVACIVAICASMQTRHPERALKLTEEVWKYLLTTWDFGMNIVPDAQQEYQVRVSADASWAPGGDRSRTGVVIRVMGVIVHWCSCRQSLSATAAHEAELNGAVTGVKLGISLRNIVRELLEHPVTMKLDQDNQGTVRTIIHEVTSWRTRHYADRASWIRDITQLENICVEHMPGVDIIADPLTKVLPKIKLTQSWGKLQLSKP